MIYIVTRREAYEDGYAWESPELVFRALSPDNAIRKGADRRPPRGHGRVVKVEMVARQEEVGNA